MLAYITVHCSRVLHSGARLTEVRKPELGEGTEKNRAGSEFKFSQNPDAIKANKFGFVYYYLGNQIGSCIHFFC